MPPAPTEPSGIAVFQGKKGFVWCRAVAIELWARCLAVPEDVQRDPEYPDQIDWLIDNGPAITCAKPLSI